MGSKHASLHFRSDNPDELIPALKKEFGKKQDPSKDERAMMLKFIKSIISDDKQRAREEANLANIMGEVENPVIVLRKRFASLYWYDRIRVENLDKMLRTYVKKMGVPTLGVAIYDDSNFIIHAVKSGEGDNECKGSYWFDEEDIHPADSEEICRILDADFLRDALKETLACESGEEMLETFEAKTGLCVLMDERMCRDAGMEELASWNGADVFCE